MAFQSKDTSETASKETTDTAAPSDGSDVIVVFGYTIEEARQELEECLARNCPPDEDIAATINLANAEFLGGEYRDARRTLSYGKNRNEKHVSDWPQEMANLYSAQATVDLHLGYGLEYERATRKASNALRDYQPDELRKELQARLSLADARVINAGYWRSAESIYNTVQKRAEAAGYDDIAAFAVLRKAALDLARAEPRNHRTILRRVQRDMTEFQTDPDLTPQLRQSANALFLRASLALGEKDEASQKIRPALSSEGKPLLIRREPINLQQSAQQEAAELNNGINANNAAVTFLSTASFEDTWADIRYLVNPDGTVSDIIVLRSEGGDPFNWQERVKESIATQVYAPLPAFKNGTQRAGIVIERFTFTSRYPALPSTTGSLIRRRTGMPIVERLELVYEEFAFDADT
ncbi:MAG: hypothetical protein AAFX04_07100 [Pseudomonadota bacterium]